MVNGVMGFRIRALPDNTDVISRRIGLAHPGIFTYGVFKSADGADIRITLASPAGPGGHSDRIRAEFCAGGSG
jgi:hypothetical protein